jgi:hypothetical protein
MLHAGGDGILFKIHIKGYIDLNQSPTQPSSPSNSHNVAPVTYTVHVPTNTAHPVVVADREPIVPNQDLALPNGNLGSHALHSPNSPRAPTPSWHLSSENSPDGSEFVLLARNNTVPTVIVSPNSDQGSNSLAPLPIDPPALPAPQLEPEQAHAEPVLEPEPDPEPLPENLGLHHSSRLADQAQGLYVNILEKALKKKKREDSELSSASSKMGRGVRPTLKNDQEEDSNMIPPQLMAEQLVRLGRECGFDGAEEGELLAVDIQVTNVE